MDKAAFFASVRRDLFGGALTPAQVEGMETSLAAFQRAKWPLAFAAYGLATKFHETAKTMQPIAEYGRGRGKKYGKPTVYGGQVAYGRGDVQLTWADPNGIDNYAKADRELAALGLISKGDLLKDFDLAMRPDLAAAIMVLGMEEGWFTGKACRDYLDKSPPDYVNARRIINGTDKASMIAGYAKLFQAALVGSGYGKEAPAPLAKPLPEPEPPPAVIVRDEPIRHDGAYTAPASEAGPWAQFASFLSRLFNRSAA